MQDFVRFLPFNQNNLKKGTKVRKIMCRANIQDFTGFMPCNRNNCKIAMKII